MECLYILIQLSPAYLRPGGNHARRDVDGVDSDLREKILERLPTIEDQEQAAEASAATAATSEEAESTPAGRTRAGAARVTLNPATLARALPHIRRLMARGSGETGDGHAASVGGLLGLLQGGGLVFPDARGAAAAAMKHGEVGRPSGRVLPSMSCETILVFSFLASGPSGFERY